MKKLLILTVALLAISTSVFAANISSGVLPIGANGSSVSTEFFIKASASEEEQGLLLKYGTNPTNAEPVTGDIEKAGSTSWDVFGDETTNTFYFFGTGRASTSKNVSVTPSAGAFKNSGYTTDVTPTILNLPTSNNFWTVVIPKSNIVGTGTYTGTYFQIQWDGTTADAINGNGTPGDPQELPAPAGDYTAEITLAVEAL